ncbi:Uncharacterised protein [Elizabethkingia miricola]|uniref:WG repeat-containing protein n=1 Tax=Elizabethkingia miricola TaxID=172045 RepID=A0ABD4DK26_ELIMR|nr:MULTISPECIES: hypothetical protein [Elizabethkingia]KUY17055.1 hypothetical protein ATB95_11785 [Elizabethkingia miricola]MCL1654655.1 hypothetical protein [Elizabethkingia miricola]QCO47621.1 hypothetical protein FCS00_15050 [Elizabethkingia sp. 2-6]WQM39767.1 hypothetical protein U2S95_05765 [Elizabethkingia miricola]SPW31781.1 Uncharacterised protein [Elizabethkingia miricola]
MRYKFIFLLFAGLCFAQQKEIKVVDAQTGEAIAKARLTLADKILYTNDDGKVLLPDNISGVEVFAASYQKENIRSYIPIVKLKPLYKDIEGVNIVNIDVKKIFEEVNKNYSRLYYNKPSVYDILYKQKNISDHKINLLLVADAKFWTDANIYNYKYAFRGDHDQFVQIGLNNIRYFQKKEENKNYFQGSSLDRSTDMIGDLFFNYELKRLIRFSNVKGTKCTGQILNERDNEQNISFKVNMPSGFKLNGFIVYNKLDKVISHFEMNYDQSAFGTIKIKNSENVEYDFHSGNGVIIFDFYKKDNKYIPTQANTYGDYYVIFNGQKHEGAFHREITFQSFKEADNKGLTNRIDFKKKIWENIPDNEKKDSDILLSEEERRFIDENK